MEIQAITETEIESVVHDISASATKRLQQFAADKQEAALLKQLRSSVKTNKEQVLEYLQRTERKGTKNQYVATNMFINTATLKAIRLELEAENKIVVYLNEGVIHMKARTASKG